MRFLSITVLAFFFRLTSPSPDAPYREPQLAASPNLVAMAFGSGSGVYVATSTDQGETFSKPVKVAEAAVLPLNRHRGPRIAIAGDSLLVTAVADGELLAWKSVDSGKTWSKAARVNDVPTAAREGLHTLAGDGHGALFAAWLDLRREGTRLYGSWSNDSGATWSKNVLVYESPDGTICQCCHPSAAFDNSGGLDVMWRNCLGGSRDFYLLHAGASRQFGNPQKLGAGTWKINACPMDGGGIAHEGSRTVTAWRREEELFLDEPGQPEQKLGEGKDIALAASNDRVAAIWIKDSQLHAWVGGKSEVLAQQAAFPNLVALPGGGFLAAWEENGAIETRRLAQK
jgi:hypothetical protein